MKLTTKRDYTRYIVQGIDMVASIERSDADLSQWNLVIDDLGLVIKLDTKAEALTYVSDLVEDNQINLI